MARSNSRILGKSQSEWSGHVTRKTRKKIPRKALEPLLDTCKELSHSWEEPAEEIFKRFLSLMKKYEDYFYSEPWPKKFDHRVSTNITDDDYEFLTADLKEFWDRRVTVLLRKNIYMDGFMGFFGMLWTDDRITDIVFRPIYKEVLEKFEEMKQNAKTIPEILATLETEYSKWIIHDSFTDYLEHNYPDKDTRNQIDDLVTKLHTEENLPSCKTDYCRWYQRIQDAEYRPEHELSTTRKA